MSTDTTEGWQNYLSLPIILEPTKLAKFKRIGHLHIENPS